MIGGLPLNTTRRPRALTVIGWLFIVVGVVGFARGAWSVAAAATVGPAALRATFSELWPMLMSELVALLGGLLILRGVSWGRWVLVAWMGFHIVLSALHDLLQLGIHVVLFAVVIYFLFAPEVSRYFRKTKESKLRGGTT